MKPWAFLLSLFLLAGCSPTDREILKAARAKGEFPPTFRSAEEAGKWARGQYVGGHMDEVRSNEGRRLVVFQHGSGRPVIKIGLYRRKWFHWELVSVHPPPALTFFQATEVDGHIVLKGERSDRTWPLPPPDNRMMPATR